MKSFMDSLSYHVNWSPEDREWVATVDQFPSLSWLQSDPVSALVGLIFLVEEVVADMALTGDLGGESGP